LGKPKAQNQSQPPSHARGIGTLRADGIVKVWRISAKFEPIKKKDMEGITNEFSVSQVIGSNKHEFV